MPRADARDYGESIDRPVVIVTDPPYYDKSATPISSDYFYVWHRRALRDGHPDLYATIVTPKDDELIATPYRHDGSKDAPRHSTSWTGSPRPSSHAQDRSLARSSDR